MYNGVGLQTARGSGTSGYVQKNMSYIAPGSKPKQQDYGKILQSLKENPLPPPRPPNKELIEHEQKRKVEAQIYKLEQELRTKSGDEALTELEIQESLKKARDHMLEKLKEAPTMINAKESHQAALAKERHMQKLKDALKIDDSKYSFGAAFDLELQEQKRLDKLAESEKIRKERKKAKKEAQKQKEREDLQRQLKEIQNGGGSRDIKRERVHQKSLEDGQIYDERDSKRKRKRSRSSSSSSSGSEAYDSSSGSDRHKKRRSHQYHRSSRRDNSREKQRERYSHHDKRRDERRKRSRSR